jgi:hypothetical protein
MPQTPGLSPVRVAAAEFLSLACDVHHCARRPASSKSASQMEGPVMRDLTQTARYRATSTTAPRQLAVWNRRLLIAAAALILWAASMLALYAMGPDARALMAGEGLLIQTDQ